MKRTVEEGWEEAAGKIELWRKLAEAKQWATNKGKQTMLMK